MKLKNLFLLRRIGFGFITALVLMLGVGVPVKAADGVSLFIDGKKVISSPSPVIKNDRTLVPVRLVSENLGAQVEWNEENRTVHIVKGSRSVLLRIDNRLVDYKEGEETYSLCDVPPQILDNRTFVPLRLVSNALGVGVKWEDSSRSAIIDSSVLEGLNPVPEIALLNIKPGQVISGTTELQVGFIDSPPAQGVQVRFQLLDPQTGKGKVIAMGNSLSGKYSWIPDPLNNGARILAAAIYNAEGEFLSGCVIPVEVAVVPRVFLTGVTQDQTLTGGISLGCYLNFIAEYVKYEITNQSSGKVTTTDIIDPQGVYDWTPQLTDNGDASIRVMACDSSGQAYYSPAVSVKVDVARQLELKGVSAGAVVGKPVTLWPLRNFPVTQVEYLLIDRSTGKEEVLAQTGYAGYTWFPGPEKAGEWNLAVRVKDTVGKAYTSGPISVQLSDQSKLLLQTVGPNQVLTGKVNLKSLANVSLSKIDYQLINPKTGAKRVIAGGAIADAEYTWTPLSSDAGSWSIQAVGTIASGGKVYSEAVPVKVYMGKIYSAKPIMEKNKFLGFVSDLAVRAQTKTGMSAALQAAQAILETGWGQSTPVDKYTGKESNNLFGIKGKGPAGSVTYNTWEEYNGNTFRIDANFRAYNDSTQSWNDHKSLLLLGSRYENFRTVMYNSTMGAWALKRAGYATDSRYPAKLIDIIKRYDLDQLDEVGI